MYLLPGDTYAYAKLTTCGGILDKLISNVFSLTRLDPWGHALAELGFVVPKHHGWPHSLTVTDGGRARYIVESRSS